MEKREEINKKRNMLLYGVFILLPFLAITAELAVKYASKRIPDYPFFKIIRFALEAQTPYIWTLPSLWGLVPMYGSTLLESYLRWLPYLFLILMPTAYWFLDAWKECKWHIAVLCIPIIFSIYQGIGSMVAAGNTLFQNTHCVFTGVPFLLEACLLVWLSVALTKKKQRTLNACGISLLVFCVLSPFVSSLLTELPSRLSMVKFAEEYGTTLNLAWGKWCLNLFSVPQIFTNAAVSAWPLFKVFTMLMYALVAFFPPQQIAAVRLRRMKKIQAETSYSYLEHYKQRKKNGGI